jgi:serine/threonine protein kinase
MIEAVEEMHSFGFIHQNIKPDNFRIMNNRVFLIDFGLTKRLFDEDGRRNKLWRLGFEGTPFYGSVKALQGYSQGPGSDISSVGFSILKLINPDIYKIPWACLKLDAHLKDFLKFKCEFLKLDGGDDYFDTKNEPIDEYKPCDPNHPEN